MSRLVFLFLLLMLTAPAMADEDRAAPRYTFVPVDGGALRLDAETGEVAFCRERDGGAVCTFAAEEVAERAAATGDVEERIAALEARVAALGAANRQFAADDEAMDRVNVLAERMMHSFFGMVREMTREMEETGQ